MDRSNNLNIYVTYCSRQKDDSLKDTGIEVTPDVLYTSKSRLVPFMDTCKGLRVRWAIFSDLYGVWFPEVKHVWYEKSPDSVTEQEFRTLLENFNTSLKDFGEIHFYRPSQIYFHGLYRRLLRETSLADRIKIFSSIFDIHA